MTHPDLEALPGPYRALHDELSAALPPEAEATVDCLRLVRRHMEQHGPRGIEDFPGRGHGRCVLGRSR